MAASPTDTAVARMRLRPRRAAVVFAVLALAAATAVVMSVSLGSVTIPPMETVRILLGQGASQARWDVVVLELRLPRTLTALVVGAALGIAGLQMQTLFRNVLADPYILGASSGASLGVALVMVVGGGASSFTAGLAGMGRAGVVIAASLGALLVLAIIVVLSAWVRSAVTLLLIGVMLGSATTALVSVLLVRADPAAAQRYLMWGQGSFAATTWGDLRIMAPVTAAGIVVAFLIVRALNALLLGPGYARSMGVGIRRVQTASIISAALLAGATTAFCGPVGFLGLITPHLSRMVFGTSDHRVLLPGVILVGATLALVCGVIAQLPGEDSVLPLNAVTALFGAPVVIGVLVRSRRGALGQAL